MLSLSVPGIPLKGGCLLICSYDLLNCCALAFTERRKGGFLAWVAGPAHLDTPGKARRQSCGANPAQLAALAERFQAGES